MVRRGDLIETDGRDRSQTIRYDQNKVAPEESTRIILSSSLSYPPFDRLVLICLRPLVDETRRRKEVGSSREVESTNQNYSHSNDHPSHPISTRTSLSCPTFMQWCMCCLRICDVVLFSPSFPFLFLRSILSDSLLFFAFFFFGFGKAFFDFGFFSNSANGN